MSTRLVTFFSLFVNSSFCSSLVDRPFRKGLFVVSSLFGFNDAVCSEKFLLIPLLAFNLMASTVVSTKVIVPSGLFYNSLRG